jgi:hypothetical protein
LLSEPSSFGNLFLGLDLLDRNSIRDSIAIVQLRFECAIFDLVSRLVSQLVDPHDLDFLLFLLDHMLEPILEVYSVLLVQMVEFTPLVVLSE